MHFKILKLLFTGGAMNKKDLNRNLKISMKIYNTLAVLKDYCNCMQEYEQIANLTPIIYFLFDEADKLYFNLTNIKIGSNERAW